MTINADYNTSTNATFDIQTFTTINTTARNLTFDAASGNASISLAQSTAGTLQVRLGNNSGGSVILNSNLDLTQNNTFFNATGFQFEGPVSGAGAITKTGLGEVRLVRDNSGWSGGLTVNEGNVTVAASGNAMGTGEWTLSGGANSTSLSVASNVTYTNAGGLVVATGDGTRTIRNYNANNVGNPTLAGVITINQNVVFDISAFTPGTVDRITVSGAIGGAGGIVKAGSGGLFLTSANSYAGATTVNGSGAGYVVVSADSGLGAAPVSPTPSHLVLNEGGLVSAGNFTLSANRGLELAGTGGQIFTNTATALAYDGIIAGTNLQKAGTGLLTLGGANSYEGTTTVGAGGLIINGTHSGLGLASVASGARIGGTGSLAGGLTIASGGLFVFNPADPTLDVLGAVTLDTTFGVASLVNADGSAMNWGSVANGTYTLFGTTASTFNTITNFGVGAAADIGSGRTAYFTNGSLQLVIVPEPGALALASLGIAVAAWARRRT